MALAISDEFGRIDTLWQSIDEPTVFFSNSYKKIREWYVLGAVQKYLKQSSSDFPESAEESESPDFITYCRDGSLWHPVEVVEVLHPEYRRNDFLKGFEHSLIQDLPPPLKEPWQPLREQINRKAQKGYPPDTCLFVYYEISRLLLPPGKPICQQLLDEHAHQPFQNLTAFLMVIILDSSMEPLVRLHPSPSKL